MRTPQKKLAALLLLWAAVILFQIVWVTEPWRLASAEEELVQLQVQRGAKLYAENCVICHGPVGEGHVGPPLNRPEWREDLTPIEQEQIKTFLTNVISRGRGGTDVTTWEFSESGGERVITSYTRMPMWGTENGGPLNEQQVEDLVVFLMNYDWPTGSGNLVAPNIPPARLTKTVQRTGQDPNTGAEITYTEEVPLTIEDLPEATGVSAAVNDRGRELFLEAGCLTCHTLGSYGRAFGPDLSNVGEWTEPDFLKEWISDPAGTVPRMPTEWMGNLEPSTIEVDWTGIHKTVMPPLEDLLRREVSEEELDTLVQYLSGLRSGG